MATNDAALWRLGDAACWENSRLRRFKLCSAGAALSQFISSHVSRHGVTEDQLKTLEIQLPIQRVPKVWNKIY